MPRKRISELTATTTPTLDDDFVLRRSNTNFRFKPALTLNAKAFGASTSASGTTNTAAINTAINEAHSRGGGIIDLPFYGTLTIGQAAGLSNVAIQLSDKQNIWLRGWGPGATILKVEAGSECHGINLGGTTQANIVISGLQIDGNRANQTQGVHGIRCLGVTGLWLHQLYVHDTFHYGLGLQGPAKAYVYVTDIRVKNTGGDGVDFKNTDDGNANISISGLQIEEFGLNASLGGQAGLDMRGPHVATNVVVRWTTNNENSGIRTRFSETDHCRLSNFHVIGNGGSTTIGLSVTGFDSVFSGGRIENCWRGVACTGSRNTVKATYVHTAQDAAFFADDEATDNTFEHCLARGTTSGAGFKLQGVRSVASNCRVENMAAAGLGFLVESAGVGSKIVSPAVVGPGAGTAVGIQLIASDCQIIGGSAEDCFRSVILDAPRGKVIGFDSDAASGVGILVNDSDDADDSQIIGCSVRNGTGTGIQIDAARVKVLGTLIEANTLGVSITSNAQRTLLENNTLRSNTTAFTDAGTQTFIGANNDGLGGLVGSSADEAVALDANSANLDVALLASRRYLFRVEAIGEDSAGNRETVQELIEVMRSGSSAPTTPIVTRESATPIVRFPADSWLAYSGLVTQATLSGNSLRVNVTNGMPAASRLTIRVWEIDRVATPEFT